MIFLFRSSKRRSIVLELIGTSVEFAAVLHERSQIMRFRGPPTRSLFCPESGPGQGEIWRDELHSFPETRRDLRRAKGGAAACRARFSDSGRLLRRRG